MQEGMNFRVTDDTVLLATKKIIDRYMNARFPVELLNLVEREVAGGNCPSCSTPMEKVDVNNSQGKFSYYKTTCNCYPKCPGVHMEGHTREVKTDSGYTIKKSYPIRIDRECGNDFTEEAIVSGAVRCNTCRRVMESYSQQEPKQKVDRSRFKG